MKLTETASLLSDALVTMNAAILANQETVPFRLFLEAGEKLDRAPLLGIAIYRDNAAKPHEIFTVRFRDNAFELVAPGDEDLIGIDWRVSEQYLQRLRDDPDRFIQDPSLLDWGWFGTRLGVR